ncbi:MAG: holo-ACP synthase [Planctomycetota bacterium]|nr:holo-ACP synthase [Planctomycetota bacterium]
MAIVGHGIDLVEVARIARLLEEHGAAFRARCFTPEEQRLAQAGGRIAERFAGRFAAKEAVLKALGTGWAGGIAWTDIELGADASGKPVLSLSGEALKRANSVGVGRWHVSISHVSGYAMASAVAEDGPA